MLIVCAGVGEHCWWEWMLARLLSAVVRRLLLLLLLLQYKVWPLLSRLANTKRSSAVIGHWSNLNSWLCTLPATYLIYTTVFKSTIVLLTHVFFLGKSNFVPLGEGRLLCRCNLSCVIYSWSPWVCSVYGPTPWRLWVVSPCLAHHKHTWSSSYYSYYTELN